MNFLLHPFTISLWTIDGDIGHHVRQNYMYNMQDKECSVRQYIYMMITTHTAYNCDTHTAQVSPNKDPAGPKLRPFGAL